MHNLFAIFKLLLKITQESAKLRDFQYRSIHKIIPFNARLYKQKLVDDATQKKKLILFIECPLIAAFWSDTLLFGKQQLNRSARLSSHELLLTASNLRKVNYVR